LTIILSCIHDAQKIDFFTTILGSTCDGVLRRGVSAMADHRHQQCGGDLERVTWWCRSGAQFLVLL
jgi:hypothetical protein